ncbi:MAG TPA: cache domain-containing protein, partial [Stellaceae bacterium]|nr:cache domain-containing protein [Stellaceae bacterium]
MSLSVRLLLLVMLAVMPAIFIEINDEVTLRAAREREMREEALRLTRAVSAEQARIGEGARQLLLAFSEIAAVYAGNSQACAEAARRIRGQVEGYVNIGLASLEGDILCSAVPLPPGVDFRNNKMLPAVDDATSLSVGTYQVGRLTGVKMLFYAVPQRNADGRVVGVLWAAVSLDWLARHFANRFTSENITLLIADRDGTILVRLPEFEEWVGRYIGDKFMPLLLRDREGVEESAGIDGTDRVIAYSPLSVDPHDIYVGVGLSKGPLFAPIDAATR